MSERYSFSLTTFSPSGKLVQIEYALAAVAAGAPSVGIKASNGVVIATEKKQKNILYDEHSIHKVQPITKHIGVVYSGMGVPRTQQGHNETGRSSERTNDTMQDGEEFLNRRAAGHNETSEEIPVNGNHRTQ
ncbi:PREDICTED: proteasome subunit alpha type-2-like [Priapulus caudatus]|uniref:Proteasome subunit alpha type n=1 Tax=Priapulus caudatus TaxID=37621 RepID=A0ABM1E5P0_PRICU|nr:PREDICTED: proteasome subunit alpha type-2-like [Priapulus caudatus]